MALHESANQIPWFATGRGGEHLGDRSSPSSTCSWATPLPSLIISKPVSDLNTSRDWRQEAEEGITEEDILAPLDNGEEQHKHKDKKHKSHGHHHKEHHKTKNSSAHSNRVSPGGREALSPAPPPPYVPSLPDEADGKRPGRANFAIPVATEDWVREWEKRKKNAKVERWNVQIQFPQSDMWECQNLLNIYLWFSCLFSVCPWHWPICDEEDTF